MRAVLPCLLIAATSLAAAPRVATADAPKAPTTSDLPVLTAKSGTCGGFEKLARIKLDAVDKRLVVAAPKGAADIPKSFDVMDAPEPTTQESRVIVESKTGGKLVIFAHELWQTASADLATRAAGYLHANTKGVKIELGKVDADPALAVFAARPSVPDKDPDAILLLSTIVRVKDGSLIGVDYLVNPPGYGDGCQALALDLAKGMKAGTRDLERTGGKQTLGPIDVDVPAGYVVTKKPGPDFDVWFLRKLAPLGEYPGYLLVYVGEYADTTSPSGPGTKVSRRGKLAGYDATFAGHTSPTGGAISATITLRGRMQLQVVEIATLRGDYLDELDTIARSIRTH